MSKLEETINIVMTSSMSDDDKAKINRLLRLLGRAKLAAQAVVDELYPSARWTDYHRGHVLAGILRYAASHPSTAEPELKLEWRDGYPPKPWSSEWFIALTTFGDRVALKPLSEDNSYDFTTADGGYLKKEKVRKWMQFPDSEFFAPAAQPVASEPEEAWLSAWRKFVDTEDFASATKHSVAKYFWNTARSFIAAVPVAPSAAQAVPPASPPLPSGDAETVWRSAAKSAIDQCEHPGRELIDSIAEIINQHWLTAPSHPAGTAEQAEQSDYVSPKPKAIGRVVGEFVPASPPASVPSAEEGKAEVVEGVEYERADGADPTARFRRVDNHQWQKMSDKYPWLNLASNWDVNVENGSLIPVSPSLPQAKTAEQPEVVDGFYTDASAMQRKRVNGEWFYRSEHEWKRSTRDDLDTLVRIRSINPSQP